MNLTCLIPVRSAFNCVREVGLILKLTTVLVLCSSMCDFMFVVGLRMIYYRSKHVALLDT